MVFTRNYFRKIRSERIKYFYSFAIQYSDIKSLYKHIISLVLITTILLPFAVQFVHSFEKHEHSVCNYQNETHFGKHKLTDCSVFHFKINTLKIDFPSNFDIIEVVEEKSVLVSSETQIASVKLNYKSSRAPPFLLS